MILCYALLGLTVNISRNGYTSHTLRHEQKKTKTIRVKRSKEIASAKTPLNDKERRGWKNWKQGVYKKKPGWKRGQPVREGI